MKYILFYSILSLCVACTKSEKKTFPPVSDIPYLVDTLTLDSGAYCFLENPIFYEDYVILFIENYDLAKGWIECRDKHTLDLIWSWQDAYDQFGFGAKGFGTFSYAYDDILAIAQNNLSYGIDVHTGKTIWFNRDATGRSYIRGDRHTIVSTTYDVFKSDASVRIADIRDGRWSYPFRVDQIDSFNVAINTCLPFTWKGNQFVTFTSSKIISSSQKRYSWLHLYDVEQNKMVWTSDTIPVQFPLSGIPGVQPVFEDGQILLANDAIYSYNIEDGSLEWWKWFGNSFTFSAHLTAADSKVFANNGDQYFIALDVHTGSEIFRTNSGGSPSRIKFHDNTCYMSGLTTGGPNHLMAFDANSGIVKYDVTAPFYHYVGPEKDWFFDRVCSVDPETGRVFTADHRRLLVYHFVD